MSNVYYLSFCLFIYLILISSTTFPCNSEKTIHRIFFPFSVPRKKTNFWNFRQHMRLVSMRLLKYCFFALSQISPYIELEINSITIKLISVYYVKHACNIPKLKLLWFTNVKWIISLYFQINQVFYDCR